MVPLIILMLSFLVLRLLGRYYQKIDSNKAGRMAFSIMLLFTGVSHFTFAKGMVMSIPDFIPVKWLVVYFTGILELLFAIFFSLEKYKQVIAKLIIAFLIAVLPANIWAAVLQVDIPNATYNGPGISYLWFRIPLQLFFIAWVYYFGVQSPNWSKHYMPLKERRVAQTCKLK